MTRISVRPVASADIEALLPELVELLREAVDDGASLGFLPPLPAAEARRYWLGLRGELRGSERLLLAAFIDGRPVGSGQLALPAWPNGRHRAELQKLLVSRALRGRGIGRLLVRSLHDAALARGRALLLLTARRGSAAERFYRALGYAEVGVIPGYTIGAAGETYDSITLYQRLAFGATSAG